MFTRIDCFNPGSFNFQNNGIRFSNASTFMSIRKKKRVPQSKRKLVDVVMNFIVTIYKSNNTNISSKAHFDKLNLLKWRPYTAAYRYFVETDYSSLDCTKNVFIRFMMIWRSHLWFPNIDRLISDSWDKIGSKSGQIYEMPKLCIRNFCCLA